MGSGLVRGHLWLRLMEVGTRLVTGYLWLRLMEHQDHCGEEQMGSGKPQESSFHRKAAWRTGAGPRVQCAVGAECFCKCLQPPLPCTCCTYIKGQIIQKQGVVPSLLCMACFLKGHLPELGVTPGSGWGQWICLPACHQPLLLSSVGRTHWC